MFAFATTHRKAWFVRFAHVLIQWYVRVLIFTTQKKQNQRKDAIRRLGTEYAIPLTKREQSLLDLSVSEIVSQVQVRELAPADVLRAYGKQAIRAQVATNCLTEIMIDEAQAKWVKECNLEGPLAGMPVSLKDTTGVAGYDSCIGYSAWVGKSVQSDSVLVKLLRDAGAIPFVKTTVPTTLLSFESTSDVFGVSTNPHGQCYSPGGSSGGEAALLAYGGSRIGIGTDVAGSVRVPAHYSGVYTIKASAYRFPKTGSLSSMPGQEGVPAVYSPMTRTLEDLETFWKAIVSMKPWDYDHSCLVMPWKEIDLSRKRLRWGVLWDDGVVLPSPPCKRALDSVVDALSKAGHELVSIDPPSPAEALVIASQLLLADAVKTATRHISPGESNDPGMRQATIMFSLPRWIKSIYAWYLRYIRGDALYAELVAGCSEKSVEEYYALVARREDYRRRWFDMWKKHDLDFVLTVPSALPAVPHGGMKEGYKACGYTFVFNLLDYAAGVLPVTHVDRALDHVLHNLTPRNIIENGIYKMFDAYTMHGLPVGVQVVGKRLEEEKVLEGMKVVQTALKENGVVYDLLRC